MSLEYTHEHENEITLFAETNYRNQKKRFGIKTDDRRRHMYVIGKTGMGKTTLLENLFYSDMANDHGCCYIDPHGDTAEKLIDFVPSHRINDVIYFNPADVDFPMGFNILETESEWQKPLVASGLMGVFKKIWPDVWSPRMEYILMNCVLALLDYPGATLLGINRLLVDKEFRARVVAKIRDPIVKTFWVAEFTAWSDVSTGNTYSAGSTITMPTANVTLVANYVRRASVGGGSGAITAPPTTEVLTYPKKLNLTVYFKGDRSYLTAATKTALKKLAATAKKYGYATNITIYGRVKETNDKSYDAKLSKARATNVAAYLKKLGVSGAFKVIAAGISPENKPISRRVDMSLYWNKR